MRRGDLLLLALLLALTLPFAGKAFTIDDPTVLAVARQIRADPLAPYSFTINWDDPQGYDQPGWTINNPPLVYAYYAAVTAVAGESEVMLHLAGLVFPATALLAMVWLGRRFAGGGVGPAVDLEKRSMYSPNAPTVIAASSLHVASRTSQQASPVQFLRR